ncbi:hypothetical protein MARA_03480 (plasmid) [Mycolicibacterium arabiense]|uniref:Uncharacterized protein n=1 Tax=Mycolicibacterium arabiense TaxID=1286181 RepID=A0A7I7RQS7_9MYCO|nr:hypothetical protein [Mycolicibacterium arabiense]BBY46918.1 hypothetical protein MARA_03480 [Mycolicibacterium arabiense]
MTALPNYETDNPSAYEWTDKAFDLLVATKLRASIVKRPGGVHVAEARGDCPRCEHDVDFSQQLSAPLPGKSGAGSKHHYPAGTRRIRNY